MKMPKEYASSPAVEEIAEKLIEILKPELESLEIRYIFCSENPKKDGQEKAGLMRKITGLNAYLAGNTDGFFVLETGKPAFDAMTGTQKIAYVHHELEHCGISDDGNLCILPHSIEEFSATVKIFGAYDTNLEIFSEALQTGEESKDSRRDLINQILGK